MSRKKHEFKNQIITGKIYKDHKQGKDKSFYDQLLIPSQQNTQEKI